MTSTPASTRSGPGRPALVGIVAAIVVLGTVSVVGAITADDDTGGSAGGHHHAAAAAGGTETATEAVAEPSHDHASGGSHAHDHAGPHGESTASYDELPAATQAEVDVVRRIAQRYPTAAAAEADGWRKATYSLEGIGAHYLRNGVLGFRTETTNGFALRDPEILLFDGEGPDAPIAGVSYLVAGDDPEGFTGDFDVWHRHNGVCFKGVVIAEIDGHEGSTISMTPEQCQAAGGLNFPIGNLTMLHVWVGEGYEGSAPIFAHDHPKLYHDTPLGQPASV